MDFNHPRYQEARRNGERPPTQDELGAYDIATSAATSASGCAWLLMLAAGSIAALLAQYLG